MEQDIINSSVSDNQQTQNSQNIDSTTIAALKKNIIEKAFKGRVLNTFAAKVTIYDTVRKSCIPFAELEVNQLDENTDRVVVKMAPGLEVDFKFMYTKSALNPSFQKLYKIC